MFNLSDDKKTKQTSVRYFENDLEKITSLANELDVSTAEVVNEWRKAYERLRLEETSNQGQNLKTLRDYLNNVELLFQTTINTSDLNVKNEQERAIESEKRFSDQVLKTNTIKDTLETTIREQKKELDKLSKELEKYQAFEENVEGRIKDKEQIIQSKNDNIIALTEEIKELKEANKSVKELEEQSNSLRAQINELKEDAKNKSFEFQAQLQQKDVERQRQLILLREELQDKFETRIGKIYDAENEKREKVREDLEARLREDYRKEIERIREEHRKEIEKLEKKHSVEVVNFNKKLDAATKQSTNTNKKA